MKKSPFFTLLLALPLAATAQTKTTTSPTKTTTTTTAPAPAATPGTQQQTEVTEDLDPATGKVIRRTTRTINVPVGTASPSQPTTTPAPAPTTGTAATAPASDAQVTAFLRRKTTVSTLSTTGLINAYDTFMERVHTDRRTWKDTDWALASNVLSSLNGRYEELRDSFSFNDKLNIRSQQAEYQTLRTARQLSDQVSDKL